MTKSVYFEYAGASYNTEDVVKKVKDDWTKGLGKKVKDMAGVKIYVKPEDNKIYYVVNEETYSVELQ